MSKAFRPLVSLAISSLKDPDILAIDIIEGNAKIHLLNVYNEADQARVGPKTLERCLFQQLLSPYTVLLGDFNTHHPWWDPLAKKTQGAD